MDYRLETEIDQPRAKVVELFGNPDNLAFWQPGFVSFRHDSGSAGQPGATARIRYRHGNGKEFDMIETLTVHNLPDEFSATYDVDGMMTMEVKNFFRDAGPNKTLWITENHAEFNTFFMKLIAFFMPGCCKKQSNEFMANFKAFAETGADVRKSGKSL